MPINVPAWLINDDPPWDFDIVPDEGLVERGVEVSVRSLTHRTSVAFGNPSFLQNLRRVIARDYAIHLSRGLTILLNDDPVLGMELQLRQSAEFVPLRTSYQDQEDASVLVELIGGMAAPPPESSEPQDEDRQNIYGWYVACNGRIVLAADKSNISGWGVDFPSWHPQYAGFMGILLFSAPNAASLPLTTTKRSVDPSSEVFRRARPLMRTVTRAWIDYTNARKQALEEAKAKEEKAVPISLRSVLQSPAVSLPRFFARQPEPVANINYSVPVEKLKRLAKELGRTNMPYREVGLKSFDYTYDDLVGKS